MIYESCDNLGKCGRYGNIPTELSQQNKNHLRSDTILTVRSHGMMGLGLGLEHYMVTFSRSTTWLSLVLAVSDRVSVPCANFWASLDSM